MSPAPRPTLSEATGATLNPHPGRETPAAPPRPAALDLAAGLDRALAPEAVLTSQGHWALVGRWAVGRSSAATLTGQHS